MRQTAICGGLAAALLQGCSLGPSVSANAVDYNNALASSANQIMLLNVLRARDLAARHHTFVSSVTGNLTLENTGMLGTTFGRNPVAPFTLSLGATVKTNPSFAVTAQDHAKFWIKLTAPVSMAVIDRLWQEGWRKEMLLLLFVEKIERVPPRPKEGEQPLSPEIWKNSVSNLTKHKEFKKKLRELRLRIARTKVETDVAATSKKKGVVRKWTETRIAYEYNFCRTNRPDKERPSSVFKCGWDTPKPKKGKKKAQTGGPQARIVGPKGKPSGPSEQTIRTQSSKERTKQDKEAPPKNGRGQQTDGDVNNKKWEIRFHIRSVEAVMHYLGEILRAQDAAKPSWVTFCSDYLDPGQVCPADDTNILFAVARGALGQSGRGLVSVPYEGDLYRTVTKIKGFPGRVRTNQVLSLMNQLQALLRNEPAVQPIAQPVRVIN